MPVQNGAAVNFSFTITSSDGGLTATGLTAHLLQSTDLEDGADKEQVRGPNGNVVSENYYDPHNKLTARWVISGASKAAAIAASLLQTAGSIVSITACASQPAIVAANWVVQPGTKVVGDVTKSAELTISFEKRAGITAVQS